MARIREEQEAGMRGDKILLRRECLKLMDKPDCLASYAMLLVFF